MPAPVKVHAGWAQWGKQVGTRDDYSVLACSQGPFSQAEFAAIMPRYAPGTPTVGSGPGELPWVVLSWVGAEDRLHLGIAIQDRTGQVDGTGRPITETRYFCVPYRELHGQPVSYSSLVDAVCRVQLPVAGGGLIQLELAPLDPVELAGAVEEFGEETVQRTAGLLLSGPVTITGSEGSKLADRLRFLDAVAALLPYGFRAKLTAATWSDSGVKHRIRLAFADRARSDGYAVGWRKPGDVPAPGEVTVSYLASLDRVRGRSADSGPAKDLTTTIGFLSRAAVPRKFDEAQCAIATVREIDLPFAVLADVRQGKGQPAEVRWLFSSEQVTQLRQDGQRAVLAELIRYGNRADRPVVIRWWDSIVGDDPRALLPDLVGYSRKMLWEEPDPAVREIVDLMQRYGLADELLAELMAPPPGRVPPEGRALAASLVLSMVFGGRRTASFPRTQAALSQNLRVAGEMLVQAAGREGASRVLGWLTPILPAEMTPFTVVLSGPRRAVSGADFDWLNTVPGTLPLLLLRAACRAARLDQVTAGFADWIRRRDSQGEQGRWHENLWELEPRTAADQACADFSQLLVGGPPRWLIIAADDPQWPYYYRCFAQLWQDLGFQIWQDNGLEFGKTLRRYLDQGSWPANTSEAQSVAELVMMLTKGHKTTALLAVALSHLVPVADNLEKPVRDWIDKALRADPDLARKGARISLDELPARAAADRIAEACERAFLVGLPPERAAKAIAKSDAVAQDPDGAGVLSEVLAGYDPGSATGPDGSWLRRLVALPFPDDSPAGDASLTAGTVPVRIARLLGVDPDKPPASLDRRQAQYAERIQAWMGEFGMAVRKTGPRRWIRR